MCLGIAKQSLVAPNPPRNSPTIKKDMQKASRGNSIPFRASQQPRSVRNSPVPPRTGTRNAKRTFFCGFLRDRAEFPRGNVVSPVGGAADHWRYNVSEGKFCGVPRRIPSGSLLTTNCLSLASFESRSFTIRETYISSGVAKKKHSEVLELPIKQFPGNE